MKFNSLITIAFSFCIYSCSSNYDFKYEQDKTEYIQAVNCLYNNYFLLFPNNSKEITSSLYQQDFIKYQICPNILTLMKRREINYIQYNKDSLVAFFSTPTGGLKSKQFVLVFFNNSTKQIFNEFSTDFKIVKKYDTGCYELERIISLAN